MHEFSYCQCMRCTAEMYIYVFVNRLADFHGARGMIIDRAAIFLSFFLFFGLTGFIGRCLLSRLSRKSGL